MAPISQLVCLHPVWPILQPILLITLPDVQLSSHLALKILLWIPSLVYNRVQISENKVPNYLTLFVFSYHCPFHPSLHSNRNCELSSRMCWPHSHLWAFTPSLPLSDIPSPRLVLLVTAHLSFSSNFLPSGHPSLTSMGRLSASSSVLP